jgi:hypothetical protein
VPGWRAMRRGALGSQHSTWAPRQDVCLTVCILHSLLVDSLSLWRRQDCQLADSHNGVFFKCSHDQHAEQQLLPAPQQRIFCSALPLFSSSPRAPPFRSQ